MMRIRTYGWLAALALGAGALAYGVSCASDNNINTSCPTYCADIQKTCTGDDSQYPTTDNSGTCLRICGGMDSGTPGQAGTDSVACRAVNVSSAKDDTPVQHHIDCVNAGVSTGVPTLQNCNTDQCTAFCNIVLPMCPGLTGYKDLPDCVATCQTWPNAFNGPLIGSTGNTLQCRTYHFELSQTGNASDLQTHCPHTGKVSARCFDAVGDAGSDAAGDATTE